MRKLPTTTASGSPASSAQRAARSAASHDASASSWRAKAAEAARYARDTELNAFLDWCDSRPQLAVSYVEAVGGAGKTRFAIEACLAAQARGWVAELLPKQDRGADDVPLPRLLVVDYVEEREATGLAERLAALNRSATMLAPVRVLLLSRPVAGVLAGRALEPLKELASGAALIAVVTAKDRSSAAAGLAVASAVHCSATHSGSSGGPGTTRNGLRQV